MEELQNNAALTFGVGLNKTEYVLFQKTVAKFTAAKRAFRALVTALVIFAVITFADILKNDPKSITDPYILSLILFFALLFFGFAVLPKTLENRRFAKGYDDAVASGQVFDGMVTVNAEGITKVTESGTVTLSFDRDLLFVERQEMFIFVNRFGQGIVLPARCMTAQDAADVRMTAQRNINPRFYMMKARLIPCAEQRMELTPVTPPAVLYTFAVQYDEKEKKALMQTVIKRDIFRTAPAAFLICFLISFSLGLENGFTAAALAFWIAVALFAGLKALFWVPRYKGTANSNGSLTVTLNECALVVEKHTDTVPQKVILQWKDVAHAVESEDTVEIYNKHQYVYIPKRCVGDVEFFRSTVNDKMKGK